MKQTINDEMKAVLGLSRRKFIELNLKYIEEERDGKLFETKTPGDCPLAQWVAYNDKKCYQETVGTTKNCPLCGKPMCPDCMNHVVEQVSRVTGYMSTVGSWNASKQQEFKDRTRYDLPHR